MYFSFIKNRFAFYTGSAILVVISLASPWIFGLNQGIDMTGGIQIEYQVSKGSVDELVTLTKNTILEEAESRLTDAERAYITDTLVYRVVGTDDFIIEAGINESADASELLDVEDTKTAFVNALREVYSANSAFTVSQKKYVNIGASFGEYIKQSGYLTLIFAVIAISLYIMYAFRGSIPGMASWPFAFVTSISLVHDVIIAFGAYVIVGFFFPEFKIDTFFITAMLTVLGYSINDSIVIMDRIRTNLKDGKQKTHSFAEIIDDAIHATMRRSLFTSLTVVIVLIAMFFFGPDSISGFTLALIFGAIVGTYSSIFLAAPMLVDIFQKDLKHKGKK